MPFLRTAQLLWVLGCFTSLAFGADTTSSTSSSASISSSTSTSGSGKAISTNTGITYLTGTRTASTTVTEKTPTGSYETFSSTVALGSTFSGTGLSSIGANASDTSSSSVTYLTGSITSSASTTISNGTVTTTATPTAKNTQACNNYVEFCERPYSNITVVGCHNSPFVRQGNAAANQLYHVTTQLDDGVRFLQAQIQWKTNDSVPHFCHTSCDILDAGPITDWLGQVKNWVASHPYDVVTILLGNGNYSTPDFYVPYIEQSGITKYVYSPSVVPMSLGSWPKLEEMIITGKRVVMFLDYMANETAYPWLMDEFSQMWETPFDPTDTSFPCTVDRPPNLAAADAENRLYLMNHNLNVEVNLLGASILVPAVSLLNTTNNVTGNGSLGAAAQTCLSTYKRAPNVLNVDYYNYGGFPGSVFEVAAKINNVTWNGKCCGIATSDGEHARVLMPFMLMAVAYSILWVLV